MSSSTPPGLIDYQAYFAKKGKQGRIAKDLQDTIERARRFHGEIQRYRFEGKTWAILSTEIEGDTEISFDPKPKYDPNRTVSDYVDELEDWQKFRGARATLTRSVCLPYNIPGRILDVGLRVRTSRIQSLHFRQTAKDDIRKEVFDVCQKQDIRQFQVMGAEHAQCFDNRDMLDVIDGIVDVIIARSRQK